jgi:hypothetical protein
VAFNKWCVVMARYVAVGIAAEDARLKEQIEEEIGLLALLNDGPSDHNAVQIKEAEKTETGGTI